MDGGCKGGEMTNVFDWVKHNGGLCSLEDYPYESGTTEQKGKCSRKCQVNKFEVKYMLKPTISKTNKDFQHAKFHQNSS